VGPPRIGLGAMHTPRRKLKWEMEGVEEESNSFLSSS
jgi:hypothetical protein